MDSGAKVYRITSCLYGREADPHQFCTESKVIRYRVDAVSETPYIFPHTKITRISFAAKGDGPMYLQSYKLIVKLTKKSKKSVKCLAMWESLHIGNTMEKYIRNEVRKQWRTSVCYMIVGSDLGISTIVKRVGNDKNDMRPQLKFFIRV